MTDRKMESRILYIVVIVLFSALFILIFGMGFTFPSFKMSNSLSTFLGALCGAGISGGAAIYVMRKDIAFRKKEKKKEIEDNFKKSYELIKMWTQSYLLSINSMNMKLKSNATINKHSLDQDLEAIRKCQISMDSINDDYIPQEIYKYFLELKSYMEMTYYQYSAYISTVQIMYMDNEEFVVGDNEHLRESLISNHQDNRKYTRARFEMIQEYEKNL